MMMPRIWIGGIAAAIALLLALSFRRCGGTVRVPRQTGRWEHDRGYHWPPVVTVNGVEYRGSEWQLSPSAWHYRERVPRHALHMAVRDSDGTWTVDHRDPWNPDFHPWRHLVFDVVLQTWRWR